MEWVNEIVRAFTTNLPTILTFIGGIVSAYFLLRTKTSDSKVEASKVAVDLARVHNEERTRDATDRASVAARFDAFMERLEREREDARREREESRKENLALQREIGEQTGRIEALTDRTREQSGTIGRLEKTVDDLKNRVSQLVLFIKTGGGEPPPEI